MAEKREDTDRPSACEHCGALVYPNTKRCPQCGHFPIRLHQCPRCKMIASAQENACPRCGRLFEPGGDYM